MSEGEDILRVKEAHEGELMEIPGVVGVAIGQDEATGEPFISVLVDQMTEEIQGLLPPELEGFPVRPEVTGPVGIQRPPQEH